MAQILPYNGDYYLWHYVPSIPGAVVFLVLFLLATIVHSWRMFRHRVWFHIPFVIGCLFEAIGYASYIAAHNNTDKLPPYIIQSIFILVAPPLCSATIYMILGRLITSLPSGPTRSFIRPSWLTKAFVLGDVQAFVIQASGGGLIASKKQAKMGQVVIVSGLIMQIMTFGVFLAAAVAFHVRYSRLLSSSRLQAGMPWRKVLWMLYAVSALVMVRSLFRTAEYIQGRGGYSMTHQWTLFVFDSSLMFLVTVVFFVMYHPRDMTRIDQEDEFIEARPLASVEMPMTSVEVMPGRK
ncbi:hypothetical protein VPNG_09977 [Cytospora leucostoma]|uniref:RTA1 domain protein n=1 Tax=Cytospora leucostoma TaxID=1230097 RepID=A0A423VK73_9PEZI|nr:hypothetical protein VPNG_09977 [Cytospora leucostoma]